MTCFLHVWSVRVNLSLFHQKFSSLGFSSLHGISLSQGCPPMSPTMVISTTWMFTVPHNPLLQNVKACVDDLNSLLRVEPENAAALKLLQDAQKKKKWQRERTHPITEAPTITWPLPSKPHTHTAPRTHRGSVQVFILKCFSWGVSHLSIYIYENNLKIWLTLGLTFIEPKY